MKIFEGVENLSKIKNAVLTQGTFDGVHTGHQKIQSHMIDEANKIDGESVLITFYPHPRFVVHPENNALKLLSTLDEKKALLEKFGLDNLIILPFDERISNLSPFEYIKDLIVDKIGPAKIIVGYDHRFGKNRAGSVNDLIAFGAMFNFEVEEIGAEMVEEITVSSTKIRHALANGEVANANNLLGYNYTFSGIVEKGMQLGRKIGYKTANIAISEVLKSTPGNGIYAAKAILNNNIFNGMMSIGNNPTIEGKGKTIEIHLFDFDKDIYNHTLTIEVVKKIRDEIKFENLDALKNQLMADEILCKQIFNAIH